MSREREKGDELDLKARLSQKCHIKCVGVTFCVAEGSYAYV